jgi:hypothetical protein
VPVRPGAGGGDHLQWPERGLVALYFDLRNQRGETAQHGENDMMVHRRSE